MLLPATISVLPFVRLSPPLAARTTVVGDDFDELGESRTKDDAVVLSCCETDFYRGRRKEKPVSSIKFIIYQNPISFA